MGARKTKKKGTSASTTIHEVYSMPDGAIVALDVMTDGESFHSTFTRQVDLEGDEEEELFDLDELLTSFIPCGRGCYVLTEGTGSVYERKGKNTRNLARLDALLTGIMRTEDGQLVVWGEDGFVARGRDRTWAPLPNLGVNVHHVVSAAETLYACGAKGMLARLDDGAWKMLDTGTKNTLLGLFPLGEDELLVLGEGGYLARIRAGVRSPIKAPKVDFHRAARLGANLWLGAGDDGLFTLSGDKLTLVKKNVYSFSLHASDDQLAIGGRNEIVSTKDGKEFPCVEIQRG